MYPIGMLLLEIQAILVFVVGYRWLEIEELNIQVTVRYLIIIRFTIWLLLLLINFLYLYQAAKVVCHCAKTHIYNSTLDVGWLEWLQSDYLVPFGNSTDAYQAIMRSSGGYQISIDVELHFGHWKVGIDNYLPIFRTLLSCGAAIICALPNLFEAFQRSKSAYRFSLRNFRRLMRCMVQRVLYSIK